MVRTRMKWYSRELLRTQKQSAPMWRSSGSERHIGTIAGTIHVSRPERYQIAAAGEQCSGNLTLSVPKSPLSALE